MISVLKPLLALGTCISLAACGSSAPKQSYQEAAIEASQNGDNKTAVVFAQKDVDRFARPDQCSRAKNLNCGTLALAYGSLAEYQILAGDKPAGERSFSNAKQALEWMDVAYRPSATGMVYRDVSEALMKVGDKQRAIAVFHEGRIAGGDSWLFMGAAAAAARAEQRPLDDR